MGKFTGLRAILGILVVGCAATDVADEQATSVTSQALQQCRGDGDGKSPPPCAAHRDPAFALGRSACESGRLVGAASNNAALASDPTYVTTLGNEFTDVTPENAMKWGTLQPVDATHWDFTQADAVVNAAQAARQSIKGHTLIWHQQLP